VLAWIAVIILFFVAKPPAARLRTIILFIAWMVLTDWEAWHPRKAVRTADFAQWCLHLARPSGVAGWLVSDQRLAHSAVRHPQSAIETTVLLDGCDWGFAGSALYVISPPLVS